jgi:hypothetical protein
VYTAKDKPVVEAPKKTAPIVEKQFADDNILL